MKKSKISFFMVFMLVLITVVNSVSAVTDAVIDTTRKGSLEITALNQENLNVNNNTPIAGVTYSLYAVADTVLDIDAAEEAIVDEDPVNSLTTGENGKVKFENLNLGRYYAKVTAYPTATSEIPESFLVDVPMVNEEGNAWIYDITVMPKIQTALGNVELTKTDLADAPMQGVEFKVQVSTQEDVWVDYVPEGADEALVVSTNAEGKISLENLPYSVNEERAKFRLIEMSAPEGYIVDNKYPAEIQVQANGTVVITDTRTGEAATAAQLGEITVVNENPGVVKEVKKQDGTFGDVASANMTDTVTFKVTVDVPTYVEDLTTYTITDNMPQGFVLGTMEVKGLVAQGGAEETVAADAYTKTDNFTLTFDTQKITKYTTIIITYDVTLDRDNVVIGEAGNVNNVSFEYTTNVDTDGTEKDTTTDEDTTKVVTGGIQIKKVDTQGTVLQGAKFKIATSEANAKNGTFLSDENGVIEVTTGADGMATIEGLAYNDDETARDYWLVETQAPTYEENGETKAYTLLGEPLRVAVDGDSHTVAVEVVNRKPFSLPLTGGIGTVLFTAVGIAIIVIAKRIKKDEVKE